MVIGPTRINGHKSEAPVDNGMAELTKYRRWVCWKRGETKADGGFAKIPCSTDPPFYPVNIQEAVIHHSYENALYFSDRILEVDGIAFVPSKEDPFCFLDIDKCISPATGQIDPWVESLVARLDSFSYITPSGRGIRIVIRGDLQHGGGYYVYWDEEGEHLLEAYDSGQMLTVTDRIWKKPIREAQEWLNTLIKVSASSSREGLGLNFSETILDRDFEEIRKEVKLTLVAHELSPEPIVENLRKLTLISIGGHLLMDGGSEEWWWEFLHKINSTLLYNKKGELEGLGEDELREVFDENLKLKPKISSKEVLERLDLVGDFLSLIRPRMKRAYNTDWNFLRALETQGRKYGSILNEEEIRIDGSWLTIQGLSRIASPKTLSKKISRLQEGEIVRSGKDQKDRAGHFILNIRNLISGEYFNLSQSEIERMQEDSRVIRINNIGIHNTHYSTILTHPFWARQYGNARGPLFAAIDSLGGGGRTGEVALRMGRIDKKGKPKCGSISGLLRTCEVEGTLENPNWGYWRFTEDFTDKLHKARFDTGEFCRDSMFNDYKKAKRVEYRERRKERLGETPREQERYDRMLREVEGRDPALYFMLLTEGTSKPTYVLDKYLVEGKRVLGVVGEDDI